MMSGMVKVTLQDGQTVTCSAYVASRVMGIAQYRQTLSPNNGTDNISNMFCTARVPLLPWSSAMSNTYPVYPTDSPIHF